MTDWNRAAAQLEKLTELQPTDYDKVMKPEDILWIKHHLRLARLNPATDIVEFTKQFMDLEPPKRIAALKKVAPTYDELKDQYFRKMQARRAQKYCYCLPQNYCDICQED